MREAKNVFCVKTVPDTDKVKGWMAEHKNRHAVIVGAGFIGRHAVFFINDQG